MPGRIDGGVIEPEGGSTVSVDNAQVPGDLRGIRGDGVGFGPFRLTGWSGSPIAVSNLAFEPAPEDDSWLPFLMAAGLVGHEAARESDDVDVEAVEASAPGPQPLSRRAIIAGGAAALLLSGTVAGQSDDDDPPRYDVASFDLSSNGRGLKVDVDTAVADYIDEDVGFFVTVNDNSIGGFEAGSAGKTINPGETGSVVVESDTALSFLDRLLASVRAEEEVAFEFRPREESFADAPTGEELVLSDQPVVVETVDETATDEVVVSMNGSLIPHADESGSSTLGEWYVRDSTALVYATAEGTPDTSLVSIRANVGLVDRLSEKYL